MLRTRIIPALLLRNESLVKTIQFGNFTYVGDPCNTVRIFNELEVDELLFLDITATTENRSPNIKILKEIADECFMPLAYGGGVSSFEQVSEILKIGFEKVAINTNSAINPGLIKELVSHFGSQAIIGSIDVKSSFFRQYQVRTHAGNKNIHQDPVTWAKKLEEYGVGEILLTSMDHEGTWRGFDLQLVKSVSEAVNVPVIAHGGAGNVKDIERVVKESKASAVALGSMVVFQKKDMGVLITFPNNKQLDGIVE